METLNIERYLYRPFKTFIKYTKKPEIGLHLHVPFLVKQLFGTKTTYNIFLFGLIIIL